MLPVTSGDLGGAALANIFQVKKKKKKVYLPSVDSLRQIGEIPANMRPRALRSFGWWGG